MKKNMGSIDRIVRAVVGVALIAWALRGGPVWAWIGVLPLATSILGFCPGYLPFGISTLKNRK
jgi:Inner membrane protein YgaP-like, transmembrane domain